MKKNIIIVPLLLVTSLFGEEINNYKKGFYVGVGASYIKLKDSNTEEITSNIGTSLQIGYIYNKYLAMEARYSHSLGEASYDKGNTKWLSTSHYPTKSSNIAIYIKPYYQLKKFKLYGLLGYGKILYTDLPTGTKDRQEIGFQWGLGVDYLLKDNISIFADYTRLYKGVGFDGHVPNSNIYSDIVTIGISYNF